MQIQQNISLKPYNTFAINAKAKLFASFSSQEELAELLSYTKYQKESKMILGGGSNVLFTKDFDGLVLKNELKGIALTGEDADHYLVTSAAGENWHQFVLYCIDKNYAGIENLSLIPGNVGASPMQNIGAYGVEIKDVFNSLEAFDIKEKKLVRFNKDDCAFGYRESVFKSKYKNRFVITNVTFCLDKAPHFNTSYGAIEQELERMAVQEMNIKNISQAVINIRSGKLPDPKVIGNAGSFFKNPTIPTNQFESLKNIFSNIIGYPSANNSIKVAAGWLIEQCGWKGYRKGDAGCHAKQALVLVNYNNASGSDILNLSSEIIDSVNKKFGITLEREVNLI